MPPIPFTSVTAVEGIATSDRRIIDPGALAWRELPLSLMAITVDSHGGMPTTQSVNVGRFDTMKREKAPDLGTGCTRITSTGVFDDTDPVAVMMARKVADKYVRGVSIDVGDVMSELEVIAEDEDGWPTDWLERLTAGTIGMATACGFPAFSQCTIQVDPEALAEATSALTASGRGLDELLLDLDRTTPWSLTAAAASPADPPRHLFADPELTGPTALTVGDPDAYGNRPVFGHVALWGVEHISLPGRFAPRSPSGYAQFMTGVTVCSDGTEINTGVLTAGIGHADLRMTPEQAKAHYDSTESIWANVIAGEDEYGIWVAGASLPLDDLQLRKIRACGLSGDWRGFNNQYDMVAALSVPVGGFPIPRSLAADGRPLAMVAAGAQAVITQSAKRLRAFDQGDLASAVRQAMQQDRRQREQEERLAKLTPARLAARVAEQNARLARTGR